MRALLLAALPLLSGCLYTNVHAPHAYRSATPSDVKASSADETVSGEACSRSALYLFAWGNSGYAAATRDALKSKPEAILYDVRSDVHARAYVLGIYASVCTVVTGRVGRAAS
jgi:hypothetical protein